jgi:hypothetical protein
MGNGCIDPRFLDLDTSWRRMVSFTPRPLYPGECSPVTHWTVEQVWMTCRSENSLLYGDWNPDPSVVKHVASRNIDCAIEGR